MLQPDQSVEFGPYTIHLEEPGHTVIYREDGLPNEPTWYELQHMKDIAFGGDQNAIEVFPPHRKLVDGQNQRHLWHVEYDDIPHLLGDDE